MNEKFDVCAAGARSFMALRIKGTEPLTGRGRGVLGSL